MDTQQIRNTFSEVEALVRQARVVAERSITFGAGSLQRLGLDTYVLRQLKTELKRYNTRTGRWR